MELSGKYGVYIRKWLAFGRGALLLPVNANYRFG